MRAARFLNNKMLPCLWGKLGSEKKDFRRISAGVFCNIPLFQVHLANVGLALGRRWGYTSSWLRVHQAPERAKCSAVAVLCVLARRRSGTVSGILSSSTVDHTVLSSSSCYRESVCPSFFKTPTRARKCFRDLNSARWKCDPVKMKCHSFTDECTAKHDLHISHLCQCIYSIMFSIE